MQKRLLTFKGLIPSITPLLGFCSGKTSGTGEEEKLWKRMQL
jgi:hypothetical protein